MHLCMALKYTSANDRAYSQLRCRILVDYPHTSRLYLSFKLEQKVISHQACQGNEVKNYVLGKPCSSDLQIEDVKFSVTFSSDANFVVMQFCILDHKTLPKEHPAQKELSPFSVLTSGMYLA